MRHLSSTRLFLLALLLSSCQSQSASKPSNDAILANDPAKIIIANYTDGQITLKDANIEVEKLVVQNDKLKGLTFEKLNSDQKEAIVKEAVLKEITSKEAKKRNLDKDKDYQDALKLFEAELLKQKLFVALAKEVADEKNVKKNYDELAEKLKDKKDIRIAYIAVKTQKEAKEIYETLLKTPSSFAVQASKKSLDKEVAKKGGDLGFVLENSLPVEVVKQARTVHKGQIAKPIQVSDKWVVIKFTDERPAEIASFENAKDAVEKNLAKKAIEDFISKNLEKAKISMLLK